MRLPSPTPGLRGEGPALRTRGSARSGRRRGTARGPALALHLSGGSLGWAVIDAAAGAQLIDAGSLALGGSPAGEALAELVAARSLPRSAARLALPGTVHLLTAEQAASLPAAAPLDGTTDVALADGRILRAGLDAAALAAALAACEQAGVEVVGAEPEALALARALAAPSPGTPPGAPLAVVWRADLALSAFLVAGDSVALLGSTALPESAREGQAAAAAARLLDGAGCSEAIVASARGDAAALARELGLAAQLPARPGDPLARIRCAPGSPADAGMAAGAVGLAIDVRGLPHVELPVRTGRGAPAVREILPSPLPADVLAARTADPGAAADAEPEAQLAPARLGAAARRRTPGSTLVAAVVAAAVVAGALVGMWGVTERGAVRDRQAALAALQAQLDAIPEPTAPTRRLLVLGADRRARVDAIASVLGSRVAWDRILREVSAVLPADAWLTGLSAGGAAGSTLKLSGYATTQQVVALALARIGIVPDLADVRLVRSERVHAGGRDVVRFSLTAAVRGESR